MQGKDQDNQPRAGPSGTQQFNGAGFSNNTITYQQGSYSPLSPTLSPPLLTGKDDHYDFPPMSDVLAYMNMYD